MQINLLFLLWINIITVTDMHIVLEDICILWSWWQNENGELLCLWVMSHSVVSVVIVWWTWAYSISELCVAPGQHHVLSLIQCLQLNTNKPSTLINKQPCHLPAFFPHHRNGSYLKNTSPKHTDDADTKGGQRIHTQIGEKLKEEIALSVLARPTQGEHRQNSVSTPWHRSYKSVDLYWRDVTPFYWFAVTHPSKWMSWPKQCQQNVLHSITKPQGFFFLCHTAVGWTWLRSMFTIRYCFVVCAASPPQAKGFSQFLADLANITSSMDDALVKYTVGSLFLEYNNSVVI